jgi:hypothetical protein
MINGRVYDWEAIKIRAVWGANIAITNISYSSEAPVDPIYARGNVARGYGVGNLAQEGSMDLPHTSFKAYKIYAATQGGLLRVRPFELVVEYGNDDQGLEIDLLPAIKIEKIETSSAQGDTEVAMRTLSFKILNPALSDGVPVI